MGVLSFRDRLRPRHWMTIGILLGGAVLVCILFFNDPEVASWYPPCVFHKSTGLYCFGCGDTRALYHLFMGIFRAVCAKISCWFRPVCFCSAPLSSRSG